MTTERRDAAERENAVLVGDAAEANRLERSDDDWSRVVPRATAWRDIQGRWSGRVVQAARGTRVPQREGIKGGREKRRMRKERESSRFVVWLFSPIEEGGGGGRRREISVVEARVDSTGKLFSLCSFFLLRFVVSPLRFLPPKHQNGSGRHCRRDQQGPRRHQDREDRQARREEGGK